MLICAISDSHRQRPKLPKADLLIHAGDLGSYGTYDELKAEIAWLKGLQKDFPLGVIYVPGNHDKALDQDLYDKRMAHWLRDPYHSYKPREIKRPPGNLIEEIRATGIKLLMDESVEVEGVKIFGSPYSTMFMDWAFMEPESALFERWRKIPEDTQFLITHGPAKGLRDLCRNGHVGSSTLRSRIEDGLPDLKAHIFGHIHEGSGIHREGRYQCWNASVANGFEAIHVLDTNTWEIAQVFKYRYV